MYLRRTLTLLEQFTLAQQTLLGIKSLSVALRVKSSSAMAVHLAPFY